MDVAEFKVLDLVYVENDVWPCGSSLVRLNGGGPHVGSNTCTLLFVAGQLIACRNHGHPVVHDGPNLVIGVCQRSRDKL